jgi:hypothetical protein
VAALSTATLAVGCSGGPAKDDFVAEMTSKASAGFAAESFWGCVYDKTDGNTQTDLMKLKFSDAGSSDAELSRRVSKVMAECLGVDLTGKPKAPGGSTTTSAPVTTSAPDTVAPDGSTLPAN